MPVQYPDTFKETAIRRYENDESIKDSNHELHISQSTIYRWRKEYRAIQAPTNFYTPAEFNALFRRLQKAEHELEAIRLFDYIAKVPLHRKLLTLADLYKKPNNPYGIHKLCDALSVVERRSTIIFSCALIEANTRMSSCRSCWRSSRSSMTASRDTEGRKYGLFLRKVVFKQAQNGYHLSCRNWGWKVSAQTQRKITKNSKRMRNRICWISSFPQTGLIRYGVMILPISESMEIGSTFVWY